MLAIAQRGFRLVRMAWMMRRIRKAESQAVKQTAQHALSKLLAGSRGLPMKVGQFMAGMDDSNSYSKLTSSVEAWPLEHIIPILEQTWQQPFQHMLKNIEESHAAASLGQVHRSYLNDKDCVAVKVQYPDIAAAIDAEMALTGLIPAGGPVKTWSFDLDSYKQTLKDTLHDELDYMHEMQQQLHFSSNIHVEGLIVPQVFPMLCRKNILVQEWMDGVRLSETKNWALPARLYIARTLMQTMFQSVFELGLVHGDPHPGNMLFQQHDAKPQTMLLDFGCMLDIGATRRLALLQLILHARGECECNLLDVFVALGFDAEKLVWIEDKIPQLCQLLFQPFIEARPFHIKQWQLSDAVAGLLGEQRWWFRSAAPADLFLIMRVFQGMVSQLETLNVQLPWWPMLKQSIQKNTMQQALEWQVGAAPYSRTPIYQGTAETLHIQVTRQDKDPIHIALPAYQALTLEALMPEHIHQHIHDANIDLKALQNRLIHDGLEPQILIDIEQESCRYKLYLT